MFLSQNRARGLRPATAAEDKFAETLWWIEMARYPCSNVRLRWFQFEELDLGVYYKFSKFQSYRSCESKDMTILPSCHRKHQTCAPAHYHARLHAEMKSPKPMRGRVIWCAPAAVLRLSYWEQCAAAWFDARPRFSDSWQIRDLSIF